jgi:hypothetical protein
MCLGLHPPVRLPRPLPPCGRIRIVSDHGPPHLVGQLPTVPLRRAARQQPGRHLLAGPLVQAHHPVDDHPGATEVDVPGGQCGVHARQAPGQMVRIPQLVAGLGGRPVQLRGKLDLRPPVRVLGALHSGVGVTGRAVLCLVEHRGQPGLPM